MADRDILIVQPSDPRIEVASYEQLITAIAEAYIKHTGRVGRLFTNGFDVVLLLRDPHERIVLCGKTQAERAEHTLLLNKTFRMLTDWGVGDGTCDLNASQIIEHERQQCLTREQTQLAGRMEKQSRWTLGFTISLFVLTIWQIIRSLFCK